MKSSPTCSIDRISVLFIIFSLGTALLGAQDLGKLSDDELLEKAIVAAEKYDNVGTLKYLYAYVQRTPDAMIRDPEHANSVREALKDAEDSLRAALKQNIQLRQQIKKLTRGNKLGSSSYGLGMKIKIKRPRKKILEINKTKAALPGDAILDYRVVRVIRSPTNYWHWKCNLEVDYTLNVKHGKGNIIIGANLGPNSSSFQSGHSYWGYGSAVEEKIEGSVIKGTQKVCVAIKLNAPQHTTHQLKVYMYDRRGEKKVTTLFKFDRLWKRP